MKVCVVVPNLNGEATLGDCLDSLLAQDLNPEIVVVENNSTDGSLDLLRQNYQGVTVLPQKKNLGFAGGVNAGIRQAIKEGCDYVALFNNDAVADKDWLKNLVNALEENKAAGIVTGKLLNSDGKNIDSTGEMYSVWGLPYPRGRSEAKSNKYDDKTSVFGASGGASLYRVTMLKNIGLFDEDFFAYYEDVDISFRAQLAGWKVAYQPKAIAYHQIGATSGKIKGFTTYQTLKNLPMLLSKNVPSKYLWRVLPRYMVAHIAFFFAAVGRGQIWTAIKGDFMGTVMLIKSRSKRRHIQKNKKVSDEYIWGMMTHDLPPNAARLRTLRSKWRKLTGRHG